MLFETPVYIRDIHGLCDTCTHHSLYLIIHNVHICDTCTHHSLHLIVHNIRIHDARTHHFPPSVGLAQAHPNKRGNEKKGSGTV